MHEVVSTECSSLVLSAHCSVLTHKIVQISRRSNNTNNYLHGILIVYVEICVLHTSLYMTPYILIKLL